MQPSTIAQIVICTVALPCVAVEPMAIDDYAVECDSLFNYVGPGNEVTRYWKLTGDDFRQVAVELGIEVATIRAVVEIEAGTHHTGFYAPMKPIINFDRTIFRSRARRAGISTAKPKEQAAIAMAPVNSRKYGSYALAQQARLDADGIIISREAEAGIGAGGLTQGQLAAIDKLNKQLDDFNVAQATQIFRIKQALMKIALDK